MKAPVTEGGSLSVLQGTALTLAAVLGVGVVSLPALAIEAAGPASMLAWAALIVISVPLAATFAALGARHPDGGGVATYARLAFGTRVATMVGWASSSPSRSALRSRPASARRTSPKRWAADGRPRSA